jgi:WD40 repeat protein
VLRKKVKGEVEPVFDSLSPKAVMTLVSPKAMIEDVAFCRGDKCVVCCDDGSIQIWNLNVEFRQREDPKLVCTSNVLKGSKIASVAASFLDDVNRIAVATDDAKLHVLTYSPSSSSITLDFTIEHTHFDGVSDLQFCPATGKVLYSKGAYSKDVFAWNVAQGRNATD